MRSLAIFAAFVLLGLPVTHVSRAQDSDLPDGDGKDLVENDCSSCHDLGVIVSQRNTKERWSTLVDLMRSRGATGTDEEFQAIVEYLAKYLGKINVNKATAKEIESTLEITANQAEAIVQYRHDHGDFKDWDDLTKVSGIDFKKLADKKDRLMYSDPSDDKTSTPKHTDG
jgi:competence protein ComEA